ncbi:MAG: anti-sigma factor [Terriglobia bacterium]
MMDRAKCLDEEQIFAYAQHILQPDEEENVRSHVEQCSACGETALRYQKLDAVLDEWKPIEPSDWFDARVRAAVASDPSARSGLTFFGLRWTQALAPACLVMLLIAGSLIVSRKRPAHPARPATQQIAQPASTPSAQVEQELTLYENLPVLEDQDYEMLSNFDVLSNLPRREKKLAN